MTYSTAQSTLEHCKLSFRRTIFAIRASIAIYNVQDVIAWTEVKIYLIIMGSSE